MSEMKKIFLVSRNALMFRKMQFSLKLIGFDCVPVRSEDDAEKLKSADPAAVFFDPVVIFRPAIEFALELKRAWVHEKTVPLFLFWGDTSGVKRPAEYAVFDDLFLSPFLRMDLYRMLKKHRVIQDPELKITPFLSALDDETIQSFLGRLRTEKTVLTPIYAEGYRYPAADEVLPGDRLDSISVLLQLFSQGELDRKLFDRIYVCPQCSSSQVSFREACPQCHSIDFSATEMLHHFPCGYVGDTEEFLQSSAEELVCPKCHKVLRHIGMDYEKPISSSRCNDCGMRFSIPAVRCRCFQCGLEFDPSDAVVQTFFSYTARKAAKKPDPSGETGTEAGPFSVSRETFVALLRQNFGISRELGFSVQILAVNPLALRESEQRELMRLLHENKRDADVLFVAPEGVILILLFYLSPEEADRQVERFRELCGATPVLARRKIPFRIHRYSGESQSDAGKVLDGICRSAISDAEGSNP